MSSIITFYSFKGGVGRTMALANIAVLLVRSGKRVLVVDWDLEAPGLDKYFRDYKIQENPEGKGLLDLLLDAKSTGQQPDWRDYLSYIDDFGGKYPLALLTSGRKEDKESQSLYAQKLFNFDWNAFFAKAEGGIFIEELREAWLEIYDVVLVDSRTGITDAGGVCTVQLPDILVLVFTTNEQSLMGAKEVALSAQRARQKLAYDRANLLVFPLPSNYDDRTQYEEAKAWLKRFANELAPFYEDWLPKEVTPLQILERTKLPYIAYFSFGEKLPVVIEGTSDVSGLGYAYLATATLIGNEFRNAESLIYRSLPNLSFQENTVY
jgi:Mrp family chromosome partitioning ATPase